MRSFPAFLAVLSVVAGPALSAQSANRIAERIDSSQVLMLRNHHPLWAASPTMPGRCRRIRRSRA